MKECYFDRLGLVQDERRKMVSPETVRAPFDGESEPRFASTDGKSRNAA
jgi:hypothetical protein